MSDTPGNDNPGKSGDLDKLKRDIITDAENSTDQRDMANEDMRFVHVAGGQWEGFLEDQTSNKRVKLELDLVSNPLWRFIGGWTSQRVGVEFKPNDSKTNETDSDLLNGIYRADFRQNSGKIAIDTAVIESATCGYGCFKLATRFEDDEDPENENMLVEWRPIHGAYNTVFWDVASQRIDKKDARHCTELLQFTRESFEAEFPDFEPSSAYEPESRSFESTGTAVQKYFKVAVRYDIIKAREKVFVYNDLISGKTETYTADDHELIKDELRKDKFKRFVRERTIIRQTVHKTVFSGDDILEPQRRIAGKWIPIVPMYGYRVWVDGQEWYWGLVRKKKDAQRIYNMQGSQVAENGASGGQRTPIFDPDQMFGTDIEAAWADRNNKTWLPARALKNEDGSIAHVGPIGYAETPGMDANVAALLEMMPKFIGETSGEIPMEVFKSEMSGKAIAKVTEIVNMNTQILRDNIRSSVAHSGDVYQAMAAEIYTRRRIVQTINRDDKDGESLLQRMVMDEKTGKLVMSNDLRGKRFQSFADVGPQYDTLNEQATEEIKSTIDLVKGVPGGEQYLPILLSLLFKNFNAAGVDELKKFNRKVMLKLGLAEPESDDERAFVAQIQDQQQQDDPQAKLLAAAAEQQQAEARSLDASSVQKVADAKKKVAETQKITSEIGTARAKIMVDQLGSVRDQARQGLAN